MIIVIIAKKAFNFVCVHIYRYIIFQTVVEFGFSESIKKIIF